MKYFQAANKNLCIKLFANNYKHIILNYMGEREKNVPFNGGGYGNEVSDQLTL